jgi:hypothetical protein
MEARMRLSPEKQKFWKAHVEAQRSSGLSVIRYCKEHGLTHHQFQYHKKKKLKSSQSKAPASFLPVRVEKKTSICIEVASVRLGFDSKTPAPTIAAIVLEVAKQNEIS